jgi:hypothetical protein
VKVGAVLGLFFINNLEKYELLECIVITMCLYEPFSVMENRLYVALCRHWN